MANVCSLSIVVVAAVGCSCLSLGSIFTQFFSGWFLTTLVFIFLNGRQKVSNVYFFSLSLTLAPLSLCTLIIEWYFYFSNLLTAPVTNYHNCCVCVCLFYSLCIILPMKTNRFGHSALHCSTRNVYLSTLYTQYLFFFFLFCLLHLLSSILVFIWKNIRPC